ncbi:MAG TPA: Ger(x)C family spore germination protein [Papillibacter sp.]|nr:Ger(x)C family spore germination protein [Papillibacter sp.]
MIRRLVAVVLLFAALLTLGGCWNYRGLDQLSIVVGIAIDYDKESRLYHLCYEIVDLSGMNKEAAIQSKTLTSSGETLFEAARNAKKKEADKLFLGSAQVLVFSHQLVQEMGILDVLDWFLRDAECRESMCVAISQEDTAAEILISSEKSSGMMSTILREIIMEDNEITASANHVQLFQVYNDLNTPLHCTAIPTLRRVKRNGDDITELNGSTVIHEDRYIGVISPEMGKYLLMVYNELKGGLITVALSDKPSDLITLEVFESYTSTDFTRDGDQITFNIKTTTFVTAMENTADLGLMNRSNLDYLKDIAQRHIEESIHSLVYYCQQELKTDILRFGEMIYKRDNKFWNEIGDTWGEVFPTVQVNVSSRVEIRNAGFIK